MKIESTRGNARPLKVAAAGLLMSAGLMLQGCSSVGGPKDPVSCVGNLIMAAGDLVCAIVGQQCPQADANACD